MYFATLLKTTAPVKLSISQQFLKLKVTKIIILYIRFADHLNLFIKNKMKR